MAQPPAIDWEGPRDDASWTGRVFIVQLSLDATPSVGTYRGRIQHFRTCDAAHFESLEELALFMRTCTDESASAHRPETRDDRS
jgi:hypothetical protein